MNRTRQLHDLGQSLWLDNITRESLDDGTLRRYIDEFSITGWQRASMARDASASKETA